MSLYKALRSLIRRVRSIAVLAVTILLLFYYTFENEIDMLNSFAENEYIPSIKNEAGIDDTSELESVRRDGVLREEATVLSSKELKTLREKNKYFPLLISEPSKDPSALLQSFSADSVNLESHKEKHPVLNEVALPLAVASGTENSKNIQSDTFEDGGTSDQVMLDQIKRLFVNSWQQARLIHDISKFRWPLTLIDALDTLYMLGEKDEFQTAVDAISEVTFSLPPNSVDDIDISDVGQRALGGLISSYQLSGNTTLFLKAKELADFLMRAFDTPNRLPLTQFFWKSKLDNRFPYQKSNPGSLTSLTLEFIKLSQITQDNKYFDAAQRIYRTFSLSTEEFDLEYLFPSEVDASGCTPISADQIQLGRHLNAFKGMKSMDENLQFIHCHQTGKLISFSPGGAKLEQHFDMDANTQLIYSNLMKSYNLLDGNDLLKVSDGYFETVETESYQNAEGEKPLKLDKGKKIKEVGQSSRFIFSKAMDSVKDLMAFNPEAPLAENLTLITSLKTRTHLSPATNEIHIEITRLYDMKLERCSLASTLALGSKVFREPKYSNFAEDLATSCFNIVKEFGGRQPVELYLDPCENEDCKFEVKRKIERTTDGSYYRSNADALEDVRQDEIKVSHEEDPMVPPTRVLAFAYRQGPSFFKPGDLDIDPNSLQWIKDPVRPLWVNKMGHMTILSPDIVEAMFYLYRTSGESKWRNMARKMLQMTLSVLQNSNGGAKGVWKINELYDDGSEMPLSRWLSRTLKFYFLLFSDKDEYSLENYTVTSGGHFLRKP